MGWAMIYPEPTSAVESGKKGGRGNKKSGLENKPLFNRPLLLWSPKKKAWCGISLSFVSL
jgi:hypothetical protein